MFARILEFVPLLEKKDEFIRVVKKDILPILKKQDGFLEILPLVPENKTEKVLAVTLWTDKKEFERDEQQWSPRVEQILKPYLSSPATRKLYTLETALCEHFEKMLIA
ncbi:MAG: antibiotic biosynthesis monooxygenase [Terriglobales bacterium]|jgi:heme-degrading monooxygenase HmoA